MTVITSKMVNNLKIKLLLGPELSTVTLVCIVILHLKPFKRQHHKMVKHTQTIRRQKPTNCLDVFDHFVGLALKGLKFNTG